MAYKKYCDTLYGEGNGLDNELRKRVELAMRNEVFKEAKSAISNHISSEVYDVYDPVLYERRYILEKAPINKDLYDDGDITLNVFSSAEPAPSVRNVPYNGPKGTFAQWINDGSMTHTMCGKTNDLFIKELLKSLRQLKVINKLWLTVCSDGVSISRNS